MTLPSECHSSEWKRGSAILLDDREEADTSEKAQLIQQEGLKEELGFLSQHLRCEVYSEAEHTKTINAGRSAFTALPNFQDSL